MGQILFKTLDEVNKNLHNSNKRMNEATVRDTKERILDAAEHHFAEFGVEATSLRQITAAAKVNLAAVNYHFQSKDELVRAVILRRIRPVNQRRLEMLMEIEASSNLSLPAVLNCLYEPIIDMSIEMESKGLRVGQMLGRLYTEPNLISQDLMGNEMRPIFQKFTAALTKLLPHLTLQEVMWRLHFSVGVLAHTLAAGNKLATLSNGQVNPHDKHEVLKQMKRYAIAGLMAETKEQNV